jgi:sulfate adenylyltransferase
MTTATTVRTTASRPHGGRLVDRFITNPAYCRRCEGMAAAKTCPHGADARVTLSGTAVRQLLEAGTLPPSEYARPEVATILRDAYVAREVVA